MGMTRLLLFLLAAVTSIGGRDPCLAVPAWALPPSTRPLNVMRSRDSAPMRASRPSALLGLRCSLGGEVGAKSAYIHIPFCNQRCFYCDFPISCPPPSPPHKAPLLPIPREEAAMHGGTVV